ncbi:ATP synthase F1 subunit epsilon [Halothiobacillus neapolitanus]|uniref:ATP synthase epsilon chain n=1 Tax=Halothiobacillus neapolitanus (strain ATCC 23641 / DSM 15147 / CIP 104769 / NCIMB 8539 / c2) TaxID=555778 RepID=D0KX14_HALNC|nr:ATP synthase F1 subunit epsilon [Halothiobacillus neapolitanus]ACX97134.1 ATP synthase F1, epsilon subunit [Halothiobacillus neapolitanus c2]TDN60268.1 ATP synthase F1 subcomplex epsilon subunit [Halothiobacillus neapolitanus]
MAMTIRVDIVSMEKPIFSGEATFVSIPTEAGEMGVTPMHTQTLSILRPGEVRVHQPDGTVVRYFVGFGVLEVQPMVVSIIADWALTEADAQGIDAAELEAKLSEESAMIADYEQRGQLDFTSAQSVMIEAEERLKWVRSMRGMGGGRH